MQHTSFVTRIVLPALGALVVGSVHAEPTFVNFETSPTGAISTNTASRTPGAYGNFTTPPNAATSGEIRAGVGLGGSNGLVVQNNGSGNDGVIDNIKSGRLIQSAGETATGAPNKYFQSSFWFRTALSTPLVPNGMQSGDFAFKTESWGSDRTTWLGFFNDNAGNLYAESSGYDAGGNGTSHILASSLTWGAWYRVVTQIDFVDGGAANDVVRQFLFDTGGNLVGSASDNTWEEGQRQFGFNSGTTVAVDAIGFQARFNYAGDAVYVDDVAWASSALAFADPLAVPEPSILALFGVAAGAALATRRRRG